MMRIQVIVQFKGRRPVGEGPAEGFRPQVLILEWKLAVVAAIGTGLMLNQANKCMD
jgi:hypothetical protein